MSQNWQRMARRLLQQSGGVGTVAISPQQVGMPMNIYPQQVGMPAAVNVGPGQFPGGQVDYSAAAYTGGGLTYMGFGSTTIPALTTGFQVHVDVRRPFLPQSLWMPSTIYGLQLVDFVVEGMGLFANPAQQGMPNELVSEVTNMPQIQWMTINPDTGGDFFVDNPTAAPLVFSGAFWGTNVTRNR